MKQTSAGELSCVNKQCYELVQFAMPENCKNWLGLIYSCVNYTLQNREIKKIRAIHYARDLWQLARSYKPLRLVDFDWVKGPRVIDSI